MLHLPPTDQQHDQSISLLGTYLLQGWIMTDETCLTEGCAVPLMRSKDGQIKFCVKHDQAPSTNTTPKKQQPTNTVNKKQEQTSDSDETRRILERREQSSKASQLIGQKMLQRWALLNDTCPNESCYAIPLIRHPSNKTIFCVICERIYQNEKDVSPIQQQQKQEEQGQLQKEEKKEPATVTEEEAPRAPKGDNQAKEPSLQRSDLAHTPLGSPIVDRSIKRQKYTSSSPSSLSTTLASVVSSSSAQSIKASQTATDTGIQCLSDKMIMLTEQIDACTKPNELADMFTAMQQCAKALDACIIARQRCEKW